MTEHASVWIRVEESGRQNAFLNLRREAPASLSKSFVEAVGCRAGDLKGEGYRPEVDCLPAWTRAGLQSTVSWPLSRLDAELAAAGIARIDVYISHPRLGEARIAPETESTRGLFGWSHQYKMKSGSVQDITLETGFHERSVWLLLIGGFVTAISPLLFTGLLGGVSGGFPGVQASVRWAAILAGSGWLWTLLFTDAPALVALTSAGLPGSRIIWAAAAITLPALVAVCLCNFAVRAKYREILPPNQAAIGTKLMFWGGIAAAGMMLTAVALFAGGDMTLPLGAIGMTVFLTGVLKRYLGIRGKLSVLDEGPLLSRIRQLAAQSATEVRGVKLILSDFDRAAAFADQTGGILLSRTLLRELSRSEVDAIVAHELSHIRRGHAQQFRGALVAVPLVFAVSFVMPGFCLWAPLLLPIGFLATMAMRRRQEWIADADAAALTGGPEALIRGLARATRGGGFPLNWGRWVGLVLAHPPTTARFAALGATAGMPMARIDELVAASATTVEDHYEMRSGGRGGGGGYRQRGAAQPAAGCIGPVEFGISHCIQRDCPAGFAERNRGVAGDGADGTGVGSSVVLLRL